MKKLAVLLALLIAGGIGATALYARYTSSDAAPKFRTAEVTRGDLMVTISATGTVEPEDLVDVGAQVVGKIKSLGPDVLAAAKQQGQHVDYTSQVEENAVLAEIDDAVYLAQRNVAKASLERAKADVLQLLARRDQAAADWGRAQELRNLKRTSLVPAGLSSIEPRPIKAIADSDYDLARFNYGAAEANVKVGEAVVQQQEASLELAETNLSYTVIRSPVKGTIIDRRVDIGQTVVASLNAPSLFLIAKDLRRMEVWTAVSEADIGRLQVGLPVHFKVDAYPQRTFHGKISQIRLNANMTQNVVTYMVIVTAENPDLKLLPYMTANPVKFLVDKRKDVLLVPNAAVRWEPRPDQMAPEAESAAELRVGNSPPAAQSTRAQADEPRPSGRPMNPAAKDDAGPPSERHKPTEHAEDLGRVWVIDGDKVRSLDVKIGSSDGSFTEISGEGIHEGLTVVVGQARAETATEAAANPFLPRFPRRPRRATN